MPRTLNSESSGEAHWIKAILEEKNHRISMLKNDLKIMERELAQTQQVYSRENEELRKRLKKLNYYDTSWMQRPQGNW